MGDVISLDSERGKKESLHQEGGKELKTYDRSVMDTGDYRAKLPGVDSEPHVVPLYAYEFLDTHDTKLSEIEDEKAESTEIGDETVERVEDQLDKSKVYGTMLKTLSEAFREVGKDKVWVVKQSGDGPGFDDWKLGHEINFDTDTMFVATKEVADQIRTKLTTEGISMGGAEVSEHMKPNYYWQFLDNDRGFILKFDGGHGLQSMVFLYGEAKKSEDVEEEKMKAST